jgi:tetratricopeptide (TPR) repeat protein
VNVLEAIDTGGEVTRVSGEAQIALEAGDTPLSSRLFLQAGKMLESAVARLSKASERDLARFLAATHYYKGGVYQEAARVCGRIQGGRLPSRVRHLYPPFLKDVKERSAPDYTRRYAATVAELYQRVTRDGDRDAAQKVIDLLIAHPYVVPHDRMAHFRARCCDVLGFRRATTLFYRDAWRFNPDRPYALPPYLDSLCKEGRYAEAWKIVEGELADHPGARSSACAMLVINAIRMRDGLRDEVQRDGEPRASLADLLKHFESAERDYRSLAAEQREGIALLIDFAFSIAWVAYVELGDAANQLETLNRWIELRPRRPDARVIRGMMTHPGAESIKDFQAAVNLKSGDPTPYYYLAAEELRSGDFREYDRLSTLALEREPDAEMRATLLTWRAISLSRRGLAAPRQIRDLIDEARQLKPDDPLIANYARAFDDEETPSLPPAIQIEDAEHRKERAKRYASRLSRQVLDGMSPQFSGNAA